MKPIGRRELTAVIASAALGSAYVRTAVAAAPTNMISVDTLADVAAVTPVAGMTIYVQGGTSLGDGFQGLFVAASATGRTVDNVLVLAGSGGWVWVRQIQNNTYLSSWWPVDSTGATACETALGQFIGALPNYSIGVLCAGTYLLGAASNWTSLTLLNKTGVKLIGEGLATLVVNATPAAAIGGFVCPVVLFNTCTSCEISNVHFNAAIHSPLSTTAVGAVACTECVFSLLDGVGFSGNGTFSEATCTASTWYRCRAQASTPPRQPGLRLGTTSLSEIAAKAMRAMATKRMTSAHLPPGTFRTSCCPETCSRATPRAEC